ncbi:MAG: serine hydrolase [Blautia sp.]|nr:serine hydrolase [Blautia sp.]
MRRENREKVFVLLGVLTLLVCTGISPCFASVFQQGGENVFAAESGADPDNPESESALFGEGMIGPSQGTDQDSIFSQASKEEPHMDDRMETVIAQVEKEIPTDNGEWSVYICDLLSGSEGTVNEAKRQAASLIKLYIMGAVYEQYEQLIRQYGQSNVDSLLFSMITVSDNDAANTLTGYLGGGDSTAGMQTVNDFCTAHGFYNSSMGRLLLHSNEFGDNYTSAMDCGRFLKEIYMDNSEEYPHAADMLQLLAAQTRRNKIPAQMPSDILVANKTGELADVENDAGIIYHAENDLVLVFLSENLAGAGSAQTSIARISRFIYDFYNAASED